MVQHIRRPRRNLSVFFIHVTKGSTKLTRSRLAFHPKASPIVWRLLEKTYWYHEKNSKESSRMHTCYSVKSPDNGCWNWSCVKWLTAYLRIKRYRRWRTPHTIAFAVWTAFNLPSTSECRWQWNQQSNLWKLLWSDKKSRNTSTYPQTLLVTMESRIPYLPLRASENDWEKWANHPCWRNSLDPEWQSKNQMETWDNRRTYQRKGQSCSISKPTYFNRSN